ncbi:MAG: hypothetical protein HY367_02085 [Candidatus Aenigmarchaeota archaeon]|nr:hypothetical protein [Candidatus Aenigmarchaeota archaeon]
MKKESKFNIYGTVPLAALSGLIYGGKGLYDSVQGKNKYEQRIGILDSVGSKLEDAQFEFHKKSPDGSKITTSVSDALSLTRSNRDLLIGDVSYTLQDVLDELPVLDYSERWKPHGPYDDVEKALESIRKRKEEQSAFIEEFIDPAFNWNLVLLAMSASAAVQAGWGMYKSSRKNGAEHKD